MAQPLSDDTRVGIIGALQVGTVSQGDIARHYGVNQSTVSRLARGYGLPPTEHAMPKEAHEGKARWDLERRQMLLDKGFDKLEGMLPGIEKARDLQSWFVSTGIAIDKMRLESDLSTQNIAVHTNDKLTDQERQRIRAILTGGVD